MQKTKPDVGKAKEPEALPAERGERPAGEPMDEVRFGFLQLVVPLVPADRKPRILQIGCGVDGFTALLLEVAEHVHAIDLAEHCVERCRKKFKERFTAAVADGKTLPDGKFDLVVSYDSLVHVDLEVLAAYLAQAQDRLVPGGHVAIHHPNRPDREWSRAPVTSRMVADLIYGLPELEMVSQTLFRVREKSFIDCFTLARRVGSQEEAPVEAASTADEDPTPNGNFGAGETAVKPEPRHQRFYEQLVGDPAWPAHHRRFYEDLIDHTENFSHIKWLGRPIWQPIPDLWTIQETIAEIRPALLIECGTHQGGSALFYAHLFDLLGRGRVMTCDIERVCNLSHPRIEFLIGSSIEDEIVNRMRKTAAEATGPVMVVLHSDHSVAHVAKELEIYHKLVTPGSFLHVQDGIIDHGGCAGPRQAILEFLADHAEFEVDRERCNRFLVTHHSMGWLRRK